MYFFLLFSHYSFNQDLSNNNSLVGWFFPYITIQYSNSRIPVSYQTELRRTNKQQPQTDLTFPFLNTPLNVFLDYKRPERFIPHCKHYNRNITATLQKWVKNQQLDPRYTK